MVSWIIYAGVVVAGATGIHFFSKLAGGSLDPIVALVFTMIAGLVFSLCCLPFAQDSIVKSVLEVKAIGLYALVGVSIALAHLGIYWMFQAGAPISIATPLVRFAPAIFALLLGLFFFHEAIKLHQLVGILMAASGFYLMVRT